MKKFRQLYIIFTLSVLILIGGGQLIIQQHVSRLIQITENSPLTEGLIKLKTLEYGVALIILSILIAEMLFLFRPAIRAMKFYKSKVTLINKELQASNTQLILSEKKLKRYVRELRKQEVALKLAKQKAEEASHMKGVFLSAMSHEIRTPLHAVTGISHLLTQENPKPEQLEYFKMLRFSADNLMTLINDILDFNKIEAGKIELEETTFNLRDLIYGIQQSLAYKALEKNINLEIIINENMPSAIVGDPTRISQILNNLVGNAIKFTEKGGVAIKVQVAEENDKQVALDFEVADTGIGIPKDKLHTIFDSFTQASSDTTRKFGGTGLGLTITKQLLKLMDSEISVNSEVGKGTIFNFTLLLGKSTELQNEPAMLQIENEYMHDRKIRLLVVEDNEINRVIAGQILKNLNLEITYAEDGLVALEKLKNKQYDIILMDLQMPKMDGYETAKTIRTWQDPYYQTVPIIALTASATTEAKNKVFDHGMNDFATKPFKPEDLFRTVIKHLNVDLKEHQSVSNVYQIREKIEQFCKGDQDFKYQLTELYIRSFNELKNEYTTALEKKDTKKLSFTMHKHTTTITLLELPHLLSEMENGKKLISSKEVNEKFIHASIARVITICDDILSELNLKVNYA